MTTLSLIGAVTVKMVVSLGWPATSPRWRRSWRRRAHAAATDRDDACFSAMAGRGAPVARLTR
jgi:hypothetical protein